MIWLKLFFSFFMIGAFTFGGGYAMLPLIQQAVLANEWLSAEELIDFIAISESTPGPFAVNVSTFVGMQTGGIVGAFCATLGVVLPSFVIILLVAKVFERFQKSRIVSGAMIGLKGAVVGLIGTALLSTMVSVFGDVVKDRKIGEAVVAALLLAGLLWGSHKKIHPIVLILISALVGILVKTFII